ncbi:MAG: LuxR family transcriptional regulator [Pseudomonadota bacterium]
MDGIVREKHDDLLERVSEETNIGRCIQIICNDLAIDFVTYHMGFNEGKKIDTPFVRTNYPAEWVREYLVKNFVELDPVAQAGFQRTLPCLWSDLDWSSDAALTVATSAIDHGIGSSGYMVPITDRRQRKAMVNYSSTSDCSTWARFVKEHASLLAELAEILHRHAILDIYGREDEKPSLSPREIECLSWMVQGKDAATIAGILNISEHTVRDYYKSAKHKLGCATLYQAIHKATLLRLIDGDVVT